MDLSVFLPAMTWLKSIGLATIYSWASFERDGLAQVNKIVDGFAVAWRVCRPPI